MPSFQRFFVVSLLALFATFHAPAQNPPTTPNIGLYIPGHGSLNWDTWYNDNWSTLDTAIGNLRTSAAPIVTPESYGALGNANTFYDGGRGCPRRS